MAETALIHLPQEMPANTLLGLRLFTLVMLVAAMTMHLRSLRVFRWEQSVSGGVLVTYCMAVLGLAFCAGQGNCGGAVLQVFLCGVGAILLAVNGFVIWRRWQTSGDLTRVVAELLQSMGVPVQRHVIIKVVLSAAAALGLFVDFLMAPMLKL